MNEFDVRNAVFGLKERKIEPTDWLLIDQDRINAFADATNDHQFIHIDPDAAAQTPFGGTIAHGFLTLSLLSYFIGEVGLLPDGLKMGVNYGLEKVRFLAPVPVNSRVRAVIGIRDLVEKRRGQFLLTCEISIEIEDASRPALVAEWLTLLITE